MTQNARPESVRSASRWIYRGVWGVLVRWFRVPEHPPELPCLPGDSLESFRPAEGFLRYLKLQFWLGFAVLGGVACFVWFAVLVASPVAGVVAAFPLATLIATLSASFYLAIHLRFDTTWYVMTGRSLRIRRGIWVIHETTITFENVQNVEIDQGPLQRWFGIADIRVDTAGGSQPQPGNQAGAAAAGHRGLIEGVRDAARIRDLILIRLRRSRTAGLGDEHGTDPVANSGWTSAQLAALREIRDAALALLRRRLPPMRRPRKHDRRNRRRGRFDSRTAQRLRSLRCAITRIPRQFKQGRVMSSSPFGPPEQNPYRSPSAREPGRPTVSESQGHIATPRAIEMLTQTRPWVRFLSVLGFIATALLAAAGLLGGMLGLTGAGGGTLADLVFGCLLLGLLHFFPSLFLWRYADRINSLQITEAAADMELALAAQRSFWRVVGIAIALMLTMSVLLLPLALLSSMMLPDQQ